MLSLTQLQTTASKHGNSASLQSIASLQVLNILEQMRANRTAVLDGNYDISVGGNPTGMGLSTHTLQQWLHNISTQLPEGQAYIQCSSLAVCELGISWRNIMTGNTNQTATSTLTVLTQL
jgi:Tfp pilus assembly protein PilV